MLNQQVRDEANHINRLMSRRNHVSGRRERRQLLQEAVDASIRGLEALRNEPLITDTKRYLEDSYERLGGNPQALKEELRHDALLLQMFLSTEQRLLRDIGINAAALQGIMDSLITVIFAGAEDPENLEEQLEHLTNELRRDLEALSRDAQRDGTASRVAAALTGLGGALIVTANGAATVASHGLAFGVGQASISFGSGIVGKAISDAFG